MLLEPQTDNIFSILRLVRENISNSSFVADFLNLLYWDDDANIRAIRNIFFDSLLPMLALTFSFVPYEQPLRRTDNANPDSEQESEIDDYSDEEEEKLFNKWKEHWIDLEED